jgi:hypothetical protein
MNLDLAFRILSEVNDQQGLAQLLRLGYGMDLSYLDSPPVNRAPISSEPSPGVLPFSSLPGLLPSSTSPSGALPFSTSALNSLLEALGRWRHISKMIYVFETLTNPLPVPAKPDNTFDDDDDDLIPIQQEWKPPSAKPNTTSFNILIKYCAAHRYPALARHYATQLMHEEHVGTVRFRKELWKRSSGAAAPHLAVNRKTLQPILGLGNRTHDNELLRWVIRACKVSIRRKYRTWVYFEHTKSYYDRQPASWTTDTTATPESSSSSTLSPTPPSSPKHSQPSTFDVHAHTWILKQDIAKLSNIKWNAADRLSNTVNRTKARLGRRVWGGKDIFMRDKNARVIVSRETWKRKVNFRRSKREVKPMPKVKKDFGKDFGPSIGVIRPSEP